MFNLNDYINDYILNNNYDGFCDSKDLIFESTFNTQYTQNNLTDLVNFEIQELPCYTPEYTYNNLNDLVTQNQHEFNNVLNSACEHLGSFNRDDIHYQVLKDDNMNTNSEVHYVWNNIYDNLNDLVNDGMKEFHSMVIDNHGNNYNGKDLINHDGIHLWNNVYDDLINLTNKQISNVHYHILNDDSYSDPSNDIHNVLSNVHNLITNSKNHIEDNTVKELISDIEYMVTGISRMFGNSGIMWRIEINRVDKSVNIGNDNTNISNINTGNHVKQRKQKNTKLSKNK